MVVVVLLVRMTMVECFLVSLLHALRAAVAVKEEM